MYGATKDKAASIRLSKMYFGMWFRLLEAEAFDLVPDGCKSMAICSVEESGYCVEEQENTRGSSASSLLSLN